MNPLLIHILFSKEAGQQQLVCNQTRTFDPYSQTEVPNDLCLDSEHPLDCLQPAADSWDKFWTSCLNKKPSDFVLTEPEQIEFQQVQSPKPNTIYYEIYYKGFQFQLECIQSDHCLTLTSVNYILYGPLLTKSQIYPLQELPFKLGQALLASTDAQIALGGISLIPEDQFMQQYLLPVLRDYEPAVLTERFNQLLEARLRCPYCSCHTLPLGGRYIEELDTFLLGHYCFEGDILDPPLPIMQFSQTYKKVLPVFREVWRRFWREQIDLYKELHQ